MHDNRLFGLSAQRLRLKRLTVWFAGALLLSLFAVVAHAQHPTNLAQLDAYFAAALKEWKVPGMAIAIVKDNEVVLAKGYGVKNLKTGGQVDEHTLFAIASNTKAFTAAALAILVDEGKISWDDRVTQYLPYFQLYDPYVTYDMRVRDLLCHRSGLGSYSGDLLWYGTSYSAEEVVKRARFLKPTATFRGDYGYSNLMFIAAGEIVPAVTGQRWETFIQKRILDELGMHNTVTSVKRLKEKPNVATPHWETNGIVAACPWRELENALAAGGINSCVSDMAKWLKLQLNRGVMNGKKIFSEEASRTMWAPHISRPLNEEREKLFPSRHFSAYGLGWGLMDYRGRKVMSHGGGTDGMSSRVGLVPEENLGMVILTNSVTRLPEAVLYKIIDAYLNAEERDWSNELLQLANKKQRSIEEQRVKAESERIPNTKPSLSLEKYAGTYGGEMYGDATVTLENGSLVVQFLPTPDLKGDLSHWHYDTFILKWRKQSAWFGDGTVHFVMDANGKVAEMKVDVFPNEGLWFTELEFKKKM